MTYKLFSTCILSKGYNISLILDIQRDSYYKIPNSLYDILCNNELLDFDSINEFYNNKKIIIKKQSGSAALQLTLISLKTIFLIENTKVIQRQHQRQH